MRRLGLAPDVVLVSSALRTRQTLQALEPWEETPLVETLDSLYLADPSQLVAALAQLRETTRSVLLIGHNPGLHELARRWSDRSDSPFARRLAEGFPTAALAEFAVSGPWARLSAAPPSASALELTRFLVPADLAGAP